MKKRNRMYAILLAAAVAVTSVFNGGAVQVNAMGIEKAAETAEQVNVPQMEIVLERKL